jgi:hypothetical protein
METTSLVEPPAKRFAVSKVIGEEYKIFCLTRRRVSDNVVETISCDKSDATAKNESPFDRWERTGHSCHEKSAEEQRLTGTSAMESIRIYEAAQRDTLRKASYAQQQGVVTAIACFMLTFFPDTGFSKMLSIWSNSTKDTPHAKFIPCEETAFLSMINEKR